MDTHCLQDIPPVHHRTYLRAVQLARSNPPFFVRPRVYDTVMGLSSTYRRPLAPEILHSFLTSLIESWPLVYVDISAYSHPAFESHRRGLPLHVCWGIDRGLHFCVSFFGGIMPSHT